MRQESYEAKKNFVNQALSRCVTAMYPRVCRLEYHLHEGGDEVVVIRCLGGYLHRVSVAGLDLRETVDVVLAELSPEVA